MWLSELVDLCFRLDQSLMEEKFPFWFMVSYFQAFSGFSHKYFEAPMIYRFFKCSFLRYAWVADAFSVS
jgi:hypothetical protein